MQTERQLRGLGQAAGEDNHEVVHGLSRLQWARNLTAVCRGLMLFLVGLSGIPVPFVLGDVSYTNDGEYELVFSRALGAVSQQPVEALVPMLASVDRRRRLMAIKALTKLDPAIREPFMDRIWDHLVDWLAEPTYAVAMEVPLSALDESHRRQWDEAMNLSPSRVLAPEYSCPTQLETDIHVVEDKRCQLELLRRRSTHAFVRDAMAATVRKEYQEYLRRYLGDDFDRLFGILLDERCQRYHEDVLTILIKDGRPDALRLALEYWVRRDMYELPGGRWPTVMYDPLAAAAITPLCGVMLHAPGSETRRTAMRILMDQNTRTPEILRAVLLMALSDPDTENREKALDYAIRDFGDDLVEKVIEKLIADHPGEGYRSYRARLMGRLEGYRRRRRNSTHTTGDVSGTLADSERTGEGTAAVPVSEFGRLLEETHSADAKARLTAITTLWRTHWQTNEIPIRERLEEMLQDSNGAVALFAASHLGDTVEKLKVLLGSEYADVRRQVVEQLASDRMREEHVDALLPLLDDPDRRVQMALLSRLAQSHRKLDLRWRPGLQKLAKHKNRIVARLATQALRK